MTGLRSVRTSPAPPCTRARLAYPMPLRSPTARRSHRRAAAGSTTTRSRPGCAPSRVVMSACTLTALPLPRRLFCWTGRRLYAGRDRVRGQREPHHHRGVPPDCRLLRGLLPGTSPPMPSLAQLRRKSVDRCDVAVVRAADTVFSRTSTVWR